LSLEKPVSHPLRSLREMAPPEVSEQILLELAALRAFVDQSRGELVQVIRGECSRLRDDLLDGRQNSARSFGLAVTDFIADDVAMREEELARIALEAARRKAAGLPGEGPLTARANNAYKAMSEASSPSAAMYSPMAYNSMAPVLGPTSADHSPTAVPQLIDALPSEPNLPLINDTVPGSVPENPFTEDNLVGNEVGREPGLVRLESPKAVMPTMPLLDDTSYLPQNDSRQAQPELSAPAVSMMPVARIQSDNGNKGSQLDTSSTTASPQSRKNPFLMTRSQTWEEIEQARLEADARVTVNPKVPVPAGDGGTQSISLVRASAPLLASSSPTGVGARSPVAGRTPSGTGARSPALAPPNGMGARSPAIAPARSPAIPPARSPAIAPARSPVAAGARSPVGYGVRSPMGARTPSGVKSPSNMLIEQQRQEAFLADGQPRLWGDEEIKGWIRVTMRMSARFPDKKERTAFLWRRYDELKVHVVPEQQADMEELAHWLVRLVEDG